MENTINQKIHDTNILATMVNSKIKYIATFNRKSFIGVSEIDMFEMK